MNTKIAVILTILVMLSLGMALFILKDYVTIGKPVGEEALTDQVAENTQPEGDGAETTLLAAATTVAGATTTAAGTTAAPATIVAGATTTTAAGGTTAAATTAPATKAATTTTQSMGAIITTTGGMGGIVTTTTQGMGALVTTTGTLAQIGDIKTTTGKPDLLISTPPRITGPNTVKPREDVWLTYVTVTNLGTAASVPCKYGYYLSSSPTLHIRGSHLIEGTIPGLQPGESATIPALSVRIPSQMSPGTYYLGIYADDHLTVDELDENNNYGVVQIIIN